jgi:AmmeMemoRadiSam system protein B/AmmeMemoRadiSam system protein A
MEVKSKLKSETRNPKSEIKPRSRFLTRRWIILINFILVIGGWDLSGSFAQNCKEPNVAGAFYPADTNELSVMIDGFLAKVQSDPAAGEIFALIEPHAGYGFSGPTAAYGYKLIEGKPYKTVIVIAPSHQYGFDGVSVYPEGSFRTPLGDVEVDSEFTRKLIKKESNIVFDPEAFAKEHALEVQLPFLQKTLTGWKLVPVVMGDCTFDTCERFAKLLKNAIGARKDVLIIASSDMYHGYDWKEASIVDDKTLSVLGNMDAEALYNGLRGGSLQMCGGFGAVTTLILSKQLGHNKIKILNHTTSAEVTGKKEEGLWTVGYASCAIGDPQAVVPEGKEEKTMLLNKAQRKKLLEIARKSIETYLRTGKKLELTESDPGLNKEMGSFVTLHKHGELRGCIGNIIGRGPLYLTVRDMAVEAAVNDPRFASLGEGELKDIEIEVSVLTPLERINDPDKIKMGLHGVLVRRGFNSGVFLPQVATETGWSRDEFMSNLCSHKAGLPADAWKDKSTEVYIFTAEVFSEKEL